MNPNGCSCLWCGSRSAGIPTGRPHSLCSWRLPDLFFLPWFSDGRDRLEPRRPPPAGVRAPHRAIAPCSAREAVAPKGHPLCSSIVALQRRVPQLPVNSLCEPSGTVAHNYIYIPKSTTTSFTIYFLCLTFHQLSSLPSPISSNRLLSWWRMRHKKYIVKEVVVLFGI